MIRGTLMEVPGDPKKSIPLFGVSGGTQGFAKQLNRRISNKKIDYFGPILLKISLSEKISL